MKDLTLLIMAAGAGSRFGGLKQIEPFGPNGEFIIDYSVYDAIRAGFNKVVFVIKEENEQIFKETIGKRIEDKIKVEYAFQKLDDLPNGYQVPEGRQKPWGTAQAILCARNLIAEPFGVINSDDFYGYDSFKKLAEFLKKEKFGSKKEYASICYPITATLSPNGKVKRGICEVLNDELVHIIECNVEKVDNKIIADPLDEREAFEISEDTLNSVNMFGFDPSLFSYLETEFTEFLKISGTELTSEFLIPEILAKGIVNNFLVLKIINSDSAWCGVTYKEDSMVLQKIILERIEAGDYSDNLWN